MSGRGHASNGLMVFIPMFRCRRQIPRVIARTAAAGAGLIGRIVVVDNRSDEGSVEAAVEALSAVDVPATVLRNDANYNLGGSHKVAFDHALAHGFAQVAVVHGDDQADFADLVPLLRDGSTDGYDCVLGSRFMRGARRQGYAWHRTAGNLAFNALFSLSTLRRISDLGSGLNLFRTAWLADGFYRTLADDLTFNNHLLLAMVARRARVRFFPISWREEDQVSNVRLFRQAWRTLGIVGGYALRRGGYLRTDRARHAAYTAQVVHQQDGRRLAASVPA